MASPPTVDFCVVCDDVRGEPGGKVTILGFYGTLPRVTIYLERWGFPMQNLLFLVSTHEGTGIFTAHINVLNPDKSLFLKTPHTIVEAAPNPEANSLVAFSFPRIVFQQQGQHEFVLFINDIESYRQPFSVSQRDPIAEISN